MNKGPGASLAEAAVCWGTSPKRTQRQSGRSLDVEGREGILRRVRGTNKDTVFGERAGWAVGVGGGVRDEAKGAGRVSLQRAPNARFGVQGKGGRKCLQPGRNLSAPGPFGWGTGRGLEASQPAFWPAPSPRPPRTWGHPAC